MADKFQDKVLKIPRAGKRAMALAADAIACVTSVLVAFYLRLDYWIIPEGPQWLAIFASLIFALPLFITNGLYRAIFRYSGWPALGAIVRAGGLYTLAYATVFTVIGVTTVPRTVGIIQPMLLIGFVGMSRVVVRFVLGGGYLALLQQGDKRRVLIYGAGGAGRQLAAAISNSEDMYVVGFVDDDPLLQGSVLNGKNIYSSLNLAQLTERLEVSDILLAMPSANRRRRSEILHSIKSSNVTVRMLPAVADLAHGRIAVGDLRELDIEDLLGRDPVPPNQILLAKNVTGKSVMVTGAGGSIGSELCRQILMLRPKTLLLLEMGEYALYAIHRELEAAIEADGLSTTLIPLLASVADKNRMSLILSTWTPDTVYHAAAYKHVPLVEHNPVEGVKNNVFGTLIAAECAMQAGVRDFVLISTDKAVRPTNIMGTTKRLAEMILQALADRQTKTRFSMVRFGNVLGSSGSVVPLFREQVRAGGPVTITHAEVTRYFMTIREAAQLVVQAGAMAQGGDVFVLDMGEPVKIADLARNMIELSGLSVRDAQNPEGDIEISVVGLRPGEKLYEELLIGDDPLPTHHERIMKAHDDFLRWQDLMPQLARLQQDIETNDVVSLKNQLKELVREFQSNDEVVDFISLERSR